MFLLEGRCWFWPLRSSFRFSSATDSYAQEAKSAKSTTTNSTSTKLPLTRTEVDKILQKARTALASSKFKEAEQLLVQAEKAKVRYPVLHFGDTPARLRRDLEKMKLTRGSTHSNADTRKANADTQKVTQKNDKPENPFLNAMRKTGPQSTATAQQKSPRPSQPSSKEALQPLPGVDPTESPVAIQSPRYRDQKVTQATSEQPINLAFPSTTSDSAKPLRIAQTPEPPHSEGLGVPAENLISPAGNPIELLREGERALRDGDRQTALKLFKSAHKSRNQLDPLSQEQLQDHLQMLSSNASAVSRRASDESLFDAATSEQTVLARQLSAENRKKDNPKPHSFVVPIQNDR